MSDQRTSRLPSPAGMAEILFTLAPAFGLGVLLTPGAYWSRLRQGRSLLSPTLYDCRRSLRRASLDGRPLSRELYLRPTPHADCHAAEVVALADELWGRTGSDWQYAQAAYDFVRNEIASAFEPVPRRGVVGTLQAGFGVCLDKLNLFVALARSGGIPARYCAAGNVARMEVFPARPAFRWVYEGLESETDWRLRRIGAGLRRRTGQGEDAQWDFFVGKWHPLAEL
ncbi:MAG: transglutaminase family protein [Candidatus Rokubacteria bacterium]|nr:transglutaminase family protein [Candidatus Rokubacteria bacterium]